MNNLTISIGQAGNQINYEIITNYSYLDYIRSFFIDSEEKVLEKILKTENIFDGINMLNNTNGRGNNWALGYSLDYKEFKKELNLSYEAFEKIIHYMEKLDFLKGFNFIHSLGGGTGSGVTTRLIELLKDHFPKLEIFDFPIIGLEIENTTLFQYNKFFTFGHIYEIVDNIFLLNNERMKNMIERFTYQNLNKCMAEIIHNIDTDKMIGKYFFSDIKFYDINYTSFNRLVDHINYDKLCKNSNQILSLDANYISDTKCDIESYHNQIVKKFNPCKNKLNCINKQNKSNTTNIHLIYKSKSHKTNIENMIEEISEKIKSRAFLFWFEKYGIVEEDYLNMFYEYDKIITAYESIDI